MKPGATTRPAASTTARAEPAAERSPTAAIRSPTIPTSDSKPGAPVPSMTIPPRRRRSNARATCVPCLVMAHLRMTIATWDLDLDGPEGQALVERIARDGAAVFRAQPGFVGYRLMRAGPRRTVAVAEWASEELALAGATKFREWLASAGVRQHIIMDTDSGPILVATDAVAGSGA